LTKSLMQADQLSVTEYMEEIKKVYETKNQPISWGKVMRDSPYETVILRSFDWSGAHKWCNETCGKDHYSWAGSNFFFTRKDDAVMFALKFG
jgi:hypothetical protein